MLSLTSMGAASGSDEARELVSVGFCLLQLTTSQRKLCFGMFLGRPEMFPGQGVWKCVFTYNRGLLLHSAVNRV